jgi:Flp pilus assembly protein TadG
MTGPRPAYAGERGDAALETVIGVPAFALFILLIIFAGRVAIARQAVGSAAAEAARSASIARTQPAAAAAAQGAAAATLADQGLQCRSTSITVDTTGFAVPAGTPARVAARVVCAVDLADLAVAWIPGTLTVESSMDSPIDTFRER